MNYLIGKFFHFFLPDKNSKILIKFKPLSNKFYSANSIFKPTILSKLIYSVNIDDIEYPKLKETTPELPFKVKKLKNFFYAHENINIVIENLLNKEGKISFVLLDSNLNIKFIYDDIFEPSEQIKEIDFSLNSPDIYKIMFYYNNSFIFFTSIKIVPKPSNDSISYSLQDDKTIFFKIQNHTDILQYEIINKFTGNVFYPLIKEKIKVKKQELYVPVNNIIENIREDNFLRYLKINNNTKYNARGMYKIVQSIRYMSQKEQINFIESLFKTDEKLAYMILNNIFNFYLLFIIPDTEKRGILKLLDITTLAAAIKSESIDNKNIIKKSMPKKNYFLLVKEIEKIKIISTDEILKAQTAIGDVIRSYYQIKFGLPFIIEEFQEQRLKEQIFNNKLVFTDKYKFTIPDFYFSGHYAVYLKTGMNENFKLDIYAKSGKNSIKYMDYWFYETKNFISIYNVDNEYIYFKFSKPVLKAQFILQSDNNIFDLTEYNHILQDEIIPVRYSNQKKILIFVGCMYESFKFDEAKFYIEFNGTQTIPEEAFHVVENEPEINIYNWLISYKKSFKDKLFTLYKIKETNLLILILEFKIYNFLFIELQDEFYKNLLDIVMNVIRYKYFKNGLFRLNLHKEYNIDDTIETLFYLRDVYDTGVITPLIDESLNLLKKKKIKDNRLSIYNKKFSNSFHKFKKEVKQKISTEDDIYYKYIYEFF